MEFYLSVASLIIAFATVVFTTYMLGRQVRQMEHERNALAILEAIDRLSSVEVARVFATLQGVNERYKTEADIKARFFGSADEEAIFAVTQFVETIATLARRDVLDPSLIVDSVGYMLRTRWASIAQFVELWRRYNDNPYIFENFEWLVRYSAWWKDTPRPKLPNYDPNQFVQK